MPTLHNNFCEFQEVLLPEFANGEIGGDGEASAATSGGDWPFSIASIMGLPVISKNTRHNRLYPLVNYNMSSV